MGKIKAPIADGARMGRLALQGATDAANGASRRYLEQQTEQAMVAGALALLGFDLIALTRDPDHHETIVALRYTHRDPGKAVGLPRVLPVTPCNWSGVWDTLRALGQHTYTERLKVKIDAALPVDGPGEEPIL